MKVNRREFLTKTGQTVAFVMASSVSFPLINRKQSSDLSTSRPIEKVVVLGIDGLDPEIVETMMGQEKLPNFSKLAGMGAFHRLQTSNPAMSPVCWTNMSTGVGPGKHGICDFLKRDPETYLPDIAIRKHTERFGDTKYLQPARCDGMWAYTSKAGIPTAVIRWPVTFPACRVKGRLLSGLGTPDLTGCEGAYVYYTTAEISPDDRSPDNVVKVDMGGGVGRTVIRGFATGPDKSAELPMTIKADGAEAVTIDIHNAGDIRCTKGAWTDWVQLRFRVGLRNMYGIIKFLLVETEPLRLYASPINIDPRHQAYPITYPESFGKELVEKQGLFHTLGMPEMAHPLSHGRYDFDGFLSEVEAVENERIRMLELELNRLDSGLLAFVIDHSDRVQHVFGAIEDKEHPAYSERYAKEYADIVPSMYRRLDKTVGNVMNALGDRAMLMVVSDHGFRSFRYSVHMNRWLIRNGYMTLNEDNSGEGKSLFRNVDWARTRAYALGFASIYINLEDREAKGVVSPGQEREQLCKELCARIQEFKEPSNGKPVVHSVLPAERGDLTKNDQDTPDLLVGFKPNYRMSWQTAVGGAPKRLIEDNDSRWMADHIIAPELIPGTVFCNRKINTSMPRSIDIAPTALNCFGIDCSGYMDGNSLLGS